MEFFRRNTAYIFVGGLFLITLGIWVEDFSITPPGVLTVAVLDIGQGDSIYIQSPMGTEVLIDGGPDTSVLRDLPQVMRYGDTSLDAVIETHPDADHIGGLVDVLARYSVGDFIEPGIDKPGVTVDKLEGEVAAEKIPRIIARRGMWLDLGGGAHLDILFPDFDVTHMDLSQDNDGGIVAHLVYGNTSVLLTADVSSAVEEHLMQIASTSELKSTILKVGHHGSKYSSSNEFLEAVAPEFAVISVGAHNRYGHPTQETLDRLAAHNIPIYRTDQDGTIVFASDGEKFISNK